MQFASNSLLTYLYFGYLPTEGDAVSFLDYLSNMESGKRFSELQNEKQLINFGVRVLRSAFRDLLVEIGDSKTHVLPLSGGLDSRAILGGLLENMNSDQIQTVTFGTPGTWDYEIGQRVAHAAGVQCEALDLTAKDWTWDTVELLKTAVQTERPIWLFDAYVNRRIPERFGEDCIYWSGFMGDPLAGSHLLAKDSKTWEQAKTEFIKRNRFARSLSLVPPDFTPEDCLPASPFVSENLLCYDEQLDFGIRQQCLIRHIVLPRGYNYQTPFLHPEWIDFILNVPRRFREKQWLYKEILKTAYPRLFSLPTKTNGGLPLGAPWYHRQARKFVLKTQSIGRQFLPGRLWGTDPGVNYIDFDRGLRERDDLRVLVHSNLQDLKARHIVDWIDIDTIWQRHQRKQGDYARALTLLASLEINLKVTEHFSQ
jgi:hypothetical protein